MKKRKNRKMKKQKIVILIMTLILIILLGILGVILFKDFIQQKSTPSKSTSEDVILDMNEEQSTVPEESTTETEDTTEAETTTDIRTVTNTATEEHHKTNGLAICMFHYIYDKNDPPAEKINNNFIEISDLKEELQYLVDNEYYFPTWEEVQQFVNGDLLLPEKSVVLTFDDGAKSFLKYASVFDEYKVPVTSFLIGSKDGEKKVSEHPSDYLTFQSHSYNMHRAGGNIGHGGIFTALSHDEAVDDLKKSIEICGHGEAFAYPYGDYNEACEQAVKDSGFLCAVTTENRRAKVGDDPLLLPRVRMFEGQSLKTFISAVE